MRSRIIVGSFLLWPADREVVETLTLTQSDRPNASGIRRLTEYQFAGDCEGHGIPTR